MHWIIVVEWVARFILMILVGLSVWSLSIIIDRYRYFQSWGKRSEGKEENLRPHLALSQELQGLQNSSEEKVFHTFNIFINRSTKEWKKGLNVLGTLGPTTPFIGLLGTIMGIIVSFGELSKGSSDMKAVMLSLAEALLLTAVGLGVAIPSVISFNYFNQKIQEMVTELDTIKETHLAQKK